LRKSLTLSAMLLAASLAPVLVAKPTPKPATNTVCPITGEKVTAKSKKVVVRGQEYYYCCGGCENKLKADPDKYLNKDGTPKNAPAKPKEHHEHHM
jgi:YHS domain-containing protein